MHQKLQGIIIRRRRLEVNWSQATLCSGICSVSHLSKIEQGKTEASPELLGLLMRRLGIEWRGDSEFYQETSAWFEELYDRLFAGEDINDFGPILAERQAEYRDSPFFLDWLMLTWLNSGHPPADVKDYVSAMDNRQYNLYLCLTGKFQELLQVADQSYFLLEAGMQPFFRGDYTKAVVCFRRGMDQAYREGSLRIMMECCGNLGTCYSCMNQLEQTREYYAAAIRMARSLGCLKDMAIMAYNLATTELQMGLPEDALRHLLERPWDEAVYFQKLAICYEQLGQKDKARMALNQALEAPITVLLDRKAGGKEQVRRTFEQICELIHIRLDDPNYLRNPEYGRILVLCIRSMKNRFPIGFTQFYASWLVEWYEANRQYHKANEILRSIFINRKK